MCNSSKFCFYVICHIGNVIRCFTNQPMISKTILKYAMLWYITGKQVSDWGCRLLSTSEKMYFTLKFQTIKAYLDHDCSL